MQILVVQIQQESRYGHYRPLFESCRKLNIFAVTTQSVSIAQTYHGSKFCNPTHSGVDLG
jgi:hypothetical protein